MVSPFHCRGGGISISVSSCSAGVCSPLWSVSAACGGLNAAKADSGAKSHEFGGHNEIPRDSRAESRDHTCPHRHRTGDRQPAPSQKRRNSNDFPIHGRRAATGPASTSRDSTAKPPATALSPANTGDSTRFPAIPALSPRDERTKRTGDTTDATGTALPRMATQGTLGPLFKHPPERAAMELKHWGSGRPTAASPRSSN